MSVVHATPHRAMYRRKQKSESSTQSLLSVVVEEGIPEDLQLRYCPLDFASPSRLMCPRQARSIEVCDQFLDDNTSDDMTEVLSLVEAPRRASGPSAHRNKESVENDDQSWSIHASKRHRQTYLTSSARNEPTPRVPSGDLTKSSLTSKISRVNVGVGTPKEAFELPATPPPPLLLTVLGRFPLVSLVQRDGTFVSSLLVYVEIDSMCAVLRGVRLRFLSALAECFGGFLGADDRIEIYNLHTSKTTTNGLDPAVELQLGAHLTERAAGRPSRDILQKSTFVTMTVTRLRLPRSKPFCVGYLPSEPMLYSITSPSWASELPPQRVCRSVPGTHIWDKQLNTKDTGPRYPYVNLVVLSEGVDMFFYGCVVDVSKGARALVLPKYGQVAAMNVDIADASLVSTLRASLLTGNPIKMSVLILAPIQEKLPFVAVGDIIRVHRSKLLARQDFRSGSVFLDISNVPSITSIALWSHDALSAPSPLDTARTDDEGNPSLTEPPWALPYWKSMVPRFQQCGQRRWEWSEQTHHPLSTYDWSIICQLGRWAGDSLYHCQCFVNTYYSTLWRLQDAEPGRYVDVVVRVVEIEMESQQAKVSEFFNSQDSSLESQTATGGVTHDPCLRSRPVGPLSTASTTHYLPCSQLRLRVTDHSLEDDGTMGEGNDACSPWILSNFSNYASTYILQHVVAGDWLRVRNVAYAGVRCLARPSQLIPPSKSTIDFYLLDGYRSRVMRLSSLCHETRHLTPSQFA